MPDARRHRRSRLLLLWLYFVALVREFRWTLVGLAGFIVLGAILYLVTPPEQFEHHPPNVLTAMYGAWMAMLAQPIYSPPPNWYLTAMCAIFPLAGFVLVGEGVVRLALLAVSRREGEKEWMRVMASTYRDHVVLCGLGHLGVRVLDHLVHSGVDVVVLERSKGNKLLVRAKEHNVPVLIRDMKEDQALIDAGIAQARAIIIATNDDMANLEVALDARRLNPKIRVVMRLFDQQIASKISDAMKIDAAFSSSTLAAPIVAAMSLQSKILATTVIGGVQHVTSEAKIGRGSALIGKRIDQAEMGYAMRVLARLPENGPVQSPPSPADVLAEGDTIVFHAAATQLATVAAESRGA